MGTERLTPRQAKKSGPARGAPGRRGAEGSLGSPSAVLAVNNVWAARSGSPGAPGPRGAPAQLRTFAFIVGTWDGKGRAKLPEGGLSPEFIVKWIGRHVLDGTAIADELHGPAPDGSPCLGITLRQYGAAGGNWVIEFLNVTGSFLRKQVSRGHGAVTVDGRDVTVHSEGPGMKIRENYFVPDDARFTYRMDVSTDGGSSWDEGWVEMTFTRAG